MKTVTKYLSKDEREHSTPEEAEAWDKATKLRDLLYAAASGTSKSECWSIAYGLMWRNPTYLDPLIAALEGVEKTAKEN